MVRNGWVQLTRLERNRMETRFSTKPCLSDAQEQSVSDWFAQDARDKGVYSPKTEGVVVASDEAGIERGFLVWSAQYGRMQVHVVIVDEDARGQGVGFGLLVRAEEIARQECYLAMFLSTMTHQAQPFYEKAGFKEVGRLLPIGGFPGRVWLEKVL
jgi:GNAT superfamily N-acetyltransferase